ncbi:uncharacterized protein LOC123321873 isoform X2 [Coccinella septempunctata]|uniref:uncharacterized protein LOC123321873 isoform X2 n=1 Tax=Coccinella septempunctata TaxID=41139 RepID=UPI001D06A93D|nr:uncharacterized protein LOC123321873 isoform X2 [Coccinella septempunctata]
MSAVVYEKEQEESFRNRMCNVPLTRTKKKEVKNSYKQQISLNISSPPPEKWDSPDFKTYMPKSDTIGEEAKFCDSYECSSDISSPPPSGDIPDFEVYTPDSTVDTDDIIDIEEEKKP